MNRDTRVLVSSLAMGLGVIMMVLGVGMGFLRAWDGGGSLALGLIITFVGFGLIMLSARMVYVIEVEDKRRREISLTWVREQLTSCRK